MAEQTDRQYFVYLDLLRESGRTNMLAAAPFLEGAFPGLSHNQAKSVLARWMEARGGNRDGSGQDQEPLS